MSLVLIRSHPCLGLRPSPPTLLDLDSPRMRYTLRRSCAACAKSKHSCDLRTPRCSRCVKRKTQCAYANEPLTAQSTPAGKAGGLISPVDRLHPLSSYRFGSLDPFDSYPQTRLPRDHVQRLIHSCAYVSVDMDQTDLPI